MSRHSRATSASSSLQADLFGNQEQPARVEVVGSVEARAQVSHAQDKTLPASPRPSRDTEPRREDDLIDVRAAAARLGLSKSTLDKMRCYGVGPAYIRSTGRAVRYDPADIDAYKKARRSHTKDHRAG